MNINIVKFFKWGFIVSLFMVGIGMLLKMGTLIRYFDFFAVIFGLLLAGFLLADLFGWYKSDKAKNIREEIAEENSSEKK